MLDNRGYTGHLIRGQPPYLLIEEAVRNRIINSYYWKEQCFGLNAATLCEKAANLDCVGGTYNAGQKPTPFLCLAFKLLQIGPEIEILKEYLRQDVSKYLTALGLFYVRLTAEESTRVYQTLEPFLGDYRKLRRRGNAGFRLTYVDEFVDELLTTDRVCGTSLWRIVPRLQLEDEDKLEARVSPMEHLLEEDDDMEEEEDEEKHDDVDEDEGASAEPDADQVGDERKDLNAYRDGPDLEGVRFLEQRGAGFSLATNGTFSASRKSPVVPQANRSQGYRLTKTLARSAML